MAVNFAKLPELLREVAATHFTAVRANALMC
jgi:hypothetical protein